jgi:hypothetical protein
VGSGRRDEPHPADQAVRSLLVDRDDFALAARQADDVLVVVLVDVDDAVAVLEIVTLVPDTDTTVVLTGMPAPVTVWPAPIRGFAAASVITLFRLTVVAVSVKTPTCCMLKAVMSPISTGVLTSLSID